VLALLVEDPAEPFEVGPVEAPVPGRRPFGVDETLALEEPDLRHRHVGELVLEVGEDLPIER